MHTGHRQTVLHDNNGVCQTVDSRNEEPSVNMNHTPLEPTYRYGGHSLSMPVTLRVLASKTKFKKKREKKRARTRKRAGFECVPTEKEPRALSLSPPGIFDTRAKHKQTQCYRRAACPRKHSTSRKHSYSNNNNNNRSSMLSFSTLKAHSKHTRMQL